MIAVDSAVRWKQRFYLRCISFSLFFSFYVSRIASALRTQKKEAEREGERKEEEKEKTENIDSSLAHFELFRFRCDPRPPLNKKKTFYDGGLSCEENMCSHHSDLSKMFSICKQRCL